MPPRRWQHAAMPPRRPGSAGGMVCRADGLKRPLPVATPGLAATRTDKPGRPRLPTPTILARPPGGPGWRFRSESDHRGPLSPTWPGFRGSLRHRVWKFALSWRQLSLTFHARRGVQPGETNVPRAAAAGRAGELARLAWSPLKHWGKWNANKRCVLQTTARSVSEVAGLFCPSSPPMPRPLPL